MINRSELRSGNLILLYNKVCRFVSSMYDTEKYSADYFHPIPLNEEWLKKLGYHQRDNGVMYHPETFNYELFRKIDSGYYRAGRYSSVERCMFVISERTFNIHQLQNLHYALTGKELTIE